MFPLKEYEGRLLEYDEEKEVNDSHLEILSYLFNCAQFFKAGSGSKYKSYLVQPSLFDVYDFEIIPVELISSIYENFIGNEFENDNVQLSKQKEIKAYYTPPYLVDYVLSQTVTPFLENSGKDDSNCRVLDPACGSGIFLVETLRKIIEKELHVTGKTKISDAKLWSLIKSNIYGVDIDPDAIDISIFSLYVTILDYKQPAEIENFRFQKLKDENFFGGLDADFFNLEHPFNSKIKNLDFIVGNPPWGNVDRSLYISYIENRNALEGNDIDEGAVPLQIGDKEICQAFLVRTSDFRSNGKVPKCSFIVSSKVLYNTGSSSKAFRNYFLRKFHVKQVVELSPVNNKIRGGNHIFDEARQPAAIITYIPASTHEYTGNNVIQHITVKPNKFFLFYKTIVVEKHDVKRIKQEYFIEEYGGDDWLWKVLVHGSALDIHFLQRLKSQFQTIQECFEELGYLSNGGLKLKDGKKKIDSSKFHSYDYLDAEKEFRPYIVAPGKKWKKELALQDIENSKVGYVPDEKFFAGNKLLIKKGLVLEPKGGEHFFGAVSAFNDKKICFSSTVCSVVPTSNNSDDSRSFLSTLSGVLNSKLFTYFLLNSSSSAGIERTRVHFAEFFNFPFANEPKIGKLALEITNRDETLDDGTDLTDRKSIDKLVNQAYKLTEQEMDLVNFAFDVSLPVLLRDSDSDAFRAFRPEIAKDEKQLQAYANIFCSFFNERFKHAKKCLRPEIILNDYFVRINFHMQTNPCETIVTSRTSNEDWNVLLGDLGIYKACKDLYFQQDVRGFTNTSFYIIKPNEKKLWHKAVAHLDVMEINDIILKAELKKSQVTSA